MNQCGIYQIKLNGKRYIGSTIRDFNQRWRLHLKQLHEGKHHSRYLQRAFNKYGESELTFSILEIVEIPEKVITIEQKYLDKFNPEYNISPTAGSPLGIKHTLQSRQNMSKSKIGNKNSLGCKRTKEARRKTSEALKGNKNTLGYKHSEEIKLAMSERLKGNKYAKGGKSRLGQIFSEETRMKMSKKAKQRWEDGIYMR